MMKKCNEDALKWFKKCNVQPDKRSGGTSFNGNACKILLNKIDILRNSKEYNICCLKYVDVLKKFNDVVDACFGSMLDVNYEKIIDDFKMQYLKCNFSVTTKVHIVFHHIKDFCSKKERGLGFYSEQAFEAVHHDFLSVWKYFKVSENHSNYDNKLRSAVRRFNSRHI